MAGNPNFDAIASTTLKNYRGKFADNVSKHIPFFNYMKMKGSVKLDGGDKIVEELMYGEGNAGSYSGNDKLTITVPTGLSAAEYSWKQIYGTVTLTGSEELRNSGKSKIQSLLEARVLQAEKTMQNRIGEMLFKDGTGNGGKDILGLDAIISTTPTIGVLGGIDRSDPQNAFWRNQANTVGSFAANGLARMGDMVRKCTRGSERPNLIVTGANVFGFIEQAANGRAQFNNPQLADLGFHALKFEGIDVIFDSFCPDGRMYFTNTDYLKFNIHTDKNFKMGKFVEPADEDVMVAKILLAAQVTASNCALQGVLYNIVA